MIHPCDQLNCPHLIDVDYNSAGSFLKCKIVTHGSGFLNTEYMLDLIRNENLSFWDHTKIEGDKQSILNCPNYNKLQLIAKLEKI